MEVLLFACFILSFVVTFLTTPIWIRKAKRKEANLTGIDVHKVNKPRIGEMGGICVIMGFLVGVLSYIAIRTFYFKTYLISLQIMAILASVLIVAIIGIIDDILGWKIGLRQKQKVFLTIAAVLPIVVLNAGHHIMHVPLIGAVNFGLIYPLIIVPIAIVGATNGFNMIAGYNGLESGMGIIILSAMGFVSWKTSDTWSSMIIFCMVFALLAFYHFNQYPARIFPGDTLTYSVGALIAIMAIMGNMEKTAVILFTPYFIQLLLKARGKMRKESFAEVNKDGSLRLRYKKIYGLEHVAIAFLSKIKKKVYERDVVYSLYLFEVIFVVLSLLFFYNSV